MKCPPTPHHTRPDDDPVHIFITVMISANAQQEVKRCRYGDAVCWKPSELGGGSGDQRGHTQHGGHNLEFFVDTASSFDYRDACKLPSRVPEARTHGG